MAKALDSYCIRGWRWWCYNSWYTCRYIPGSDFHHLFYCRSESQYPRSTWHHYPAKIYIWWHHNQFYQGSLPQWVQRCYIHACTCTSIRYSTTNVITIDLYPGRELNEEEKYELVTAATYMHIKREELGRQFLNQDRYVLWGGGGKSHCLHVDLVPLLVLLSPKWTFCLMLHVVLSLVHNMMQDGVCDESSTSQRLSQRNATRR